MFQVIVKFFIVETNNRSVCVLGTSHHRNTSWGASLSVLGWALTLALRSQLSKSMTDVSFSLTILLQKIIFSESNTEYLHTYSSDGFHGYSVGSLSPEKNSCMNFREREYYRSAEPGIAAFSTEHPMLFQNSVRWCLQLKGRGEEATGIRRSMLYLHFFMLANLGSCHLISPLSFFPWRREEVLVD